MATKIEYLVAHIEDRLQDIANDMYELQQENKRLTAELEEARAALLPLADCYEMPRAPISELIHSGHAKRAHDFLAKIDTAVSLLESQRPGGK